MSKTTVLIVEDEAIVAADLAGKLEQLGYQVAGIASNGEDAIELACGLKPAAVLMDIRLQGTMDGIEAAEAIRRRYDVPVIYLTAHSDTATLERAKISQPFGYILKPFEERELSATIKMALYKHQSDLLLREQREWLRVTLTSIGDAVITCDTGGRVNFINPVAEELTGWRFEDARDRPIGEVFRLMDELTGRLLEDPVALVLREGIPMALTDNTALVTRDGREIPVEDSASPILGVDGRVVGAVVVFHDVTGKRRAEEILRKNEQLLRLFIEYAPASLAMFDRQMRYLYVSKRWLNDYHLGDRDLRGVSHYDVFPEIGEKWKTIHRRCLAGEVIRADSDRFERCDGSVQWLCWEVRPWRDSTGAVAGIVVFSEDVTERKLAEEALRERDVRLRRAEEMAHLGHWSYDLATGRVSWSEEMYRIHGLQRDGEPTDRTVYGIAGYCHPDDLEQCLLSFEPIGRQGGNAFEYRIIRPDGDERHVISDGEIERDEHGSPVALFGTLLDVTELRRNERELQEKNTQLERFTYMISHDMKSPLVTLKTFLGYLDIDLAKNDAGRIEKDMHYMRSATDRMWRLLDELLEMLRVGRAIHQPEIVACRGLVEEALDLVAGQVAERGVEILNSVPDIRLFGDRPRLVEIWQNLVENACKFMGDQAHPRIEIGAEKRGRETLFFVRDNGAGIEPQFQEKIFGLFEKLDRHSDGTGLGLALVRRIVELHGGKIRVESQGTGQGSCFRFTLPGALKSALHEREQANGREGDIGKAAVTEPRRSEPLPVSACPVRG